MVSLQEAEVHIRKEQLEVLSGAATDNFKGQLVVHFQKYFPRQYSVLGEASTRLIIERGIGRALQHGFKSGQEICQYINLMMSVGLRFDTDPTLPWASTILKDSGLTNDAKLKRLVEAADSVLRRIVATGEFRAEG
jgi:hypothetical protein